MESPPLGIKILCIIASIFPIISLLLVPFVVIDAPILAVGETIISITQLIVIYGIWHMVSWGWFWGMITLGFNALTSIVVGYVIGLTVSLLLLVYLLSLRPYYRSNSYD